MKKSLAIFIALALPCLILAQTNISKNIPLNNAKSVSIDFEWGDVKIESWDGNTVSIEGNFLVNGESMPERFEITSSASKGQLVIKSDADLEGIEKVTVITKKDGTTIYKKNDNISIFNAGKNDEIKSTYSGTNVDAQFTIKIPKSIDLEVNSTYGKIEINEYFEGMQIRNTYGCIDAVFATLPSSPNMEISSTYSTVDVSIPSNANLKLSMKSGYGSIYTDLDFKPDTKKRGGSCPQGEDITAVLNTGSGKLELESGYSNIYLRKTK